MASVLRGTTRALTGNYESGGVATDPDSPTVTVIDSNDVAYGPFVPTRQGTGLYTYDYPVSSSAALGIWLAQWGGAIGGVPVFGVEPFEVLGDPGSTQYTVADLIEQTKQYLFTGGRDPRNRLAAVLTSSATSLTVDFALGAIRSDAKIAIDLEDMHVWSASGTTVTVERGQYGTDAAAHDDGAIITVNPRFSNAEIFRALNEELASLSSPSNGLYRMRTTNLTYNPVYRGYDLAGITDLTEVYEVRYESAGASREWPLMDDWDISHNMDPGEFSSTTALFLANGASGNAVRVRYKAPFVRLVAITDDVETRSEIPPTAVDILPIGTAIRLAAGREIRRNFDESQGDTRRAEEVPPGANLNSPRNLERLRALRIREEAARLAQKYPERHRRVPVRL